MSKDQRQIHILGIRHTISDVRRRCIIEATIEPLVPFPRGFARSKAGPFFELRTVNALVEAGALRVVRLGGKGRGRQGVQLTARAA